MRCVSVLTQVLLDLILLGLEVFVLLLQCFKTIEKGACLDLLFFQGALCSKVLVKLSIMLFSKFQILVTSGL